MPHEPKRRHSRERKGERRSSISFAAPQGVKCPNCGAMTVPHQICAVCGFYKGQEVIKK